MTGFRLASETMFAERLPPGMKAKVLCASRQRSYTAGAVIHQSGQESGSVSIIHSGQVRMSKLGSDGARVTIADLGPGESFGLMALLSEHPRTHDALALTPVRLFEISRATFRRLMNEVPDFRDHVILQLADRLMRALEAVEDERRFSLKVRLAKLLLQKAGTSHSIRVTQVALAEELGVSRYGVGLGLKALKDKGLVQTTYGEVLILGSERLRRLVRSER